MVAGEACVVAMGVRGCLGACMVAGGHAWLLGGGCAWLLGGYASRRGGMRGI